jgi:chitodextrinase
VGVTGHDILRNGTKIATSPTNSYNDLSVSPSTPYTYTVAAYDAAGNTSAASSAANVTTPAPSNNPPVISNVTTTNVTSTSATITWTTDIPSSSQVLYGTSSSYTQSTALDTTQVTSHAQTVTGLSASTTYHFAVQSTASTSNTATSPDNQFTTTTSNITLPDMQLKVPASAISIDTNPSNGDRQLQFTHITWDAGAGPFEIDPTYNSATGTATWVQAI